MTTPHSSNTRGCYQTNQYETCPGNDLAVHIRSEVEALSWIATPTRKQIAETQKKRDTGQRQITPRSPRAQSPELRLISKWGGSSFCLPTAERASVLLGHNPPQWRRHDSLFQGLSSALRETDTHSITHLLSFPGNVYFYSWAFFFFYRSAICLSASLRLV